MNQTKRTANKLELLDRLESRVALLTDRKSARLILANIQAARADIADAERVALEGRA